MAEAPSALILGGCGFVGRNLVQHLVEKKLCSKIKVVDRTMPAMAFLSDVHKAAFASVEFKQADLTRPAGVEKAFEGGPYTLVYNLTYDGVAFGQEDRVYEEKVLGVSTGLYAAAVKNGATHFIELSTAQVYEPSDKACNEGGKLKPWTKQAGYKLQAEEALAQQAASSSTRVINLRCATVYGPGDVFGVMPRVICAAVYKHLGEKMKFLWDGKLRLNTVHVADVAAAMWHVTTLRSPSFVYNLADRSDSSQGSINAALEALFGISTGFAGTMGSQVVKTMGLKCFAEGVNEKHMEAWGELCKGAGILNTPLTAHLDAELLKQNHLAVDGRAIEATGFAYSVPQLTAASLRPQIDAYIAQKLFPPVL